METHGPLGTLWVGFGLIGFYLALIWLNTLLGIFLTPLFLIPGTWLMDFVQRRKRVRENASEAEGPEKSEAVTSRRESGRTPGF
jgi:hypothetical protein